MILTATLLLLTYFPVSFESSPIFQIPLRHSSRKFIDAEVENDFSSGSEHALPVGPNYNLHGMLGQGYYIELAIGQPKQLINVLIDTGSSNFAVAASPDFGLETFFNVSRSQTFVNLSSYIHVPYSQGSWSGFLGTDVIRITSLVNSTAFRANVAMITESSDFFVNGSKWQGILGLAYSEIAQPSSDAMPFFDSLTSELSSISDIFSLQLCGAHSESSDIMDGLLVVGGVASSLYVGDLLYVPLRREWYYEVIVTDIMVNGVSLGLDCKEYNFDKTIVDSGTTDLRLPTRVYDATLQLMKQQTHTTNIDQESFWQGDDISCWSRGHLGFQYFPTLTIALAASANETIEVIVSPRQYLRLLSDRESYVGMFSLDPQYDCFRVSISPSDSGTVIGAVVMEGFYVVFDRQNKRIGFAQTACNSLTMSDSVVSHVEGPFHSPADTADCGYARPSIHQTVAVTAAYTVIAICAFCLLVIFSTYLYRRIVAGACCRRRDSHSDDSSLLDRPLR